MEGKLNADVNADGDRLVEYIHSIQRGSDLKASRKRRIPQSKMARSGSQFLHHTLDLLGLPDWREGR